MVEPGEAGESPWFWPPEYSADAAAAAGPLVGLSARWGTSFLSAGWGTSFLSAGWEEHLQALTMEVCTWTSSALPPLEISVLLACAAALCSERTVHSGIERDIRE